MISPERKRGRLLAAGALAGLAAAAGAAITVEAQRREAERAFPPEGRFMTADGVSLHYTDTEGSGEVLVMLHGNGAMIADLAISGLVERMAGRYRTIVFDRPGYGYSARPRGISWGAREQARLFHDALRKLGVERAVVFGHSWGTLVALAMAMEFPHFVSGLVLAAGFYYPEARADAAALSIPAIPVAGDVMRHTLAPFLTRGLAPEAIAKMFAPLPVTERFEREFPLSLSFRPEQLRASAEELRIMNRVADDLSEGYHRIHVPTAIVAGEADHIVDTERQSVRLAQEIPGSKLTLLPDMGHMLHHFEAERLAAIIDGVADGTDAPQG
jgi:pimeloyl-ACP methyl ester carboxylesterase